MPWSTIVRLRRFWSGAAALLLTACSAEPTRVIELPDAQMAKGGGGGSTSSVAVTSTIPGFGKRGERLSVRILGSGFTATSQATWERGGVADPRVTVLSTTFVSSSEVVADVQITEDADLVFYDVAVTITLVDGGRKKGIGIEKFEVTSAVLLPTLSGPGNNSLAWNLNDAGAVVGRSNTRAFYWDQASGIQDLGSGQAFGIAESGTMIVGANNNGLPRDAMVWTGGPGNWTGARLSTACLTNLEWSSAQSIGRAGSLIGGRANVTVSRNKSKQLPVLWDSPTSPCRVLTLPAGADGGTGVNEVNDLGMAVGGASMAGGMRAVVWDAAGVPTILAPVPGDAFSGAHAIAPNGQIVVGLSGNRSTYWVRTETGWSAGIPLTNTCGGSSQTWARGVNDDGVVVGSACDGGRWWRVVNGVVTQTGRMPGLGPTDHPIAEAISNNSLPGTAWAVGGGAGATFWRVP